MVRQQRINRKGKKTHFIQLHASINLSSLAAGLPSLTSLTFFQHLRFSSGISGVTETRARSHLHDFLSDDPANHALHGTEVAPGVEGNLRDELLVQGFLLGRTGILVDLVGEGNHLLGVILRRRKKAPPGETGFFFY